MEEAKPNSEFNFRELINNLINKPNNLWLLLGLIGLGLVLLINVNDKESSANPKQTTLNQSTIKNQAGGNTESEETRLETKLSSILETIAGAGKVWVELNLKSSGRKVWERQDRVSKRVSQGQGSVNTEEESSDELVFARDRDGRDSPILKEELAPEIQGVIIVATGAGDGRIRQLLTETVMTVLGIPAHRIMVIPGEIKGGTSE